MGLAALERGSGRGMDKTFFVYLYTLVSKTKTGKIVNPNVSKTKPVSKTKTR